MIKEKKTPEQIKADREEEEALVSRIRHLSNVVPKSHNQWSYQKSVSFKTALIKAVDQSKRARRSLPLLRSTLAELQGYYT